MRFFWSATPLRGVNLAAEMSCSRRSRCAVRRRGDGSSEKGWKRGCEDIRKLSSHWGQPKKQSKQASAPLLLLLETIEIDPARIEALREPNAPL